MELSIRPLNYEERKYTYAQSTQLQGQTGSIGHLRGDFDSNGHGFYTTWFDHRPQWKTDEFKAEFDDVINSLRSENGELLKNRFAMASFARAMPDSKMKGNYCTEYGFRVDTEKHSYLIRCNPVKGDYNFYCFCYVKEWLDQHIEKARQDIRFIDSGYKDLFRLPDGKSIVVTQTDGKQSEYTCRYIDPTHLEVGNNLYHICEFAERMERNGSTYAPKEPPLPPKCFSVLPSDSGIISINRYEKGYTPVSRCIEGKTIRETADFLNQHLGVSKAQESAMLSGSMFGWDTPAANPKNYDENGNLMKPKNKEHER